ncbi:MFS transporter [Anderseniella sp. Alg231-50]|uniref:MFS transporter n=1 Tax=Anderseniella sp. Alg231-50 TaxID=1922226 RepID=UPI00307B6995
MVTESVKSSPQAASPASLALALSIWSLSALAFGYAFFQRVAPSVMIPDLMAEFAVTGAVMGQLSALYFYPYAAMQLPIGALLDRYGARLMLTIALLLAAVGSIIFGTAGSVNAAYTGRFMVGAGSAVGFIASMALAARWFHPRHFALLTGLAMFFAMVCGIAGQAPLALAVEAFGWRQTMIWAGVFAAGLAALTALVVRNSPDAATAEQANDNRWAEIWAGLKDTIKRSEIWRIAIVAMSMSGPMLALGGLWGVPFLAGAYELDRPTSAIYTSLSLLGWAVGAPLSGWLSDRIGRRKLPLVVGTASNFALLAIIAFVPNLSLTFMATAFFLSGLTGGCMVVTFALAREVSARRLHGSVSGLVNAATVGAGAILQPIIGWMLDLRWDGTMLEGARIYQTADYRFAFICLVVWSGAGFLLSLTLRETNCKPVVQ